MASTTGESSTEVDVTQGWVLYVEAYGIFETHLSTVVRDIENASTLSMLLAAWDPARFRRVSEAATRELLKAWQVSTKNPTVRTAAQQIFAQRPSFSGYIDSAASAVRDASIAVRALNLPESTGAAFLHGATNALDQSSQAGAGAASGAVLGTMLFPGIGTMVGGALGAMIGQNEQTSRNAALLTAFDQATAELRDAIPEVLDACWDMLVERTSDGGLALPLSKYFHNAETAWADIRARVLDAPTETTASKVSIVDAFVEEWGPHPNALTALCRLRLYPVVIDLERAKAWSDYQIRLFPDYPDTYENASDVAMEMGSFSKAIELAQIGLRKHPDHRGLRLSALEGFAAVGRMDAAYAEVERLHLGRGEVTTMLVMARGLVRAGRNDAAGDVVTKWIGREGRAAAVGRYLRRDPWLRGLESTGRVDVPGGLGGELFGLVEEYIPLDNDRHFLGRNPADRLANAMNEFLNLNRSEELLYFRDWSVWGNGKTGFVLTTESVQWKCMWEAPVRIELRSLDPASVVAEGQNLHVAGQSVDAENTELAQSTAQLIIEVINTLREHGVYG